MTAVEREALFRDSLGIAHCTAGLFLRRQPPHVSSPEVHDACIVALWQAAQKWSPNRGTQFKSYAILCCRREASRAIRRERRRGLTFVRDRVEDPDYRAPAFERLHDKDTRLAREEQRTREPDDDTEEVIRDLLASLTMRQRQALRRLFFEGATVRDLAREWSRSRQYAHGVKAAAIRAARQYLADRGVG